MTTVVSFDFDDTLTDGGGTPNHAALGRAFEHAAAGHSLIIVTYRNRAHECPEWIAANNPGRARIEDFINEHDLPVASVHFTDHLCKGPPLRALGASLHYDDDTDAVESAREYGVEGVDAGEEFWRG